MYNHALNYTTRSSVVFSPRILTRLVFMYSYRGLPEPSAIMNSVYMMQVWPIFWSYLDRLIQRYSSLNYRYTARDQIRGLRIIWTFSETIYRTDILVYQLPFPLFCNFAIDIFKHVILPLIFLHTTHSYSFHCILHHMFY